MKKKSLNSECYNVISVLSILAIRFQSVVDWNFIFVCFFFAFSFRCVLFFSIQWHFIFIFHPLATYAQSLNWIFYSKRSMRKQQAIEIPKWREKKTLFTFYFPFRVIVLIKFPYGLFTYQLVESETMCVRGCMFCCVLKLKRRFVFVVVLNEIKHRTVSRRFGLYIARACTGSQALRAFSHDVSFFYLLQLLHFTWSVLFRSFSAKA